MAESSFYKRVSLRKRRPTSYIPGVNRFLKVTLDSFGLLLTSTIQFSHRSRFNSLATFVFISRPHYHDSWLGLSTQYADLERLADLAGTEIRELRARWAREQQQRREQRSEEGGKATSHDRGLRTGGEQLVNKMVC